MHNVHIGIVDQIAVIVISRNLFTRQLQTGIQVILIHIANGNQSGSAVTKVGPAHASNTYNPLGQLITRRRVARSTQHVTRHNRQCQRPKQTLL